jgi:hypothetical protein
MKNNLLLAVILVGIALVAGMIWNLSINRVFGEVAIDAQTYSTTTPQLADRANLCPPSSSGTASSTTGVLDFVYISAPLTADFLIMDATTTNSTLRLPTATSSNILVWFPAGTGTSTVKLGIQFKRGLLVDYGAGVASTTIGYRCEGSNPI